MGVGVSVDLLTSGFVEAWAHLGEKVVDIRKRSLFVQTILQLVFERLFTCTFLG